MLILTKPSKVLNPVYRKVAITRSEINTFKSLLRECLEHIAINEQKKESEENVKKYIGEFLHKSFYQEHLINTKDRIDLAIYQGKDAHSPVSVLIEAKRPSNAQEFLHPQNINKKALQELLLYYLKERVTAGNNQIKHLIATNGYEWYFFKGEDFYTLFYKNKRLIKEYNEFIGGQKDSSKNELFYTEIAAQFIEEVQAQLPFLYINIKDFESLLPLENTDDDKLVALYKVFSPVHLLGKAYGNDSNQLNKQFYYELLHIIGLEEVKEGGKKLIQRKAKATRNHGSLLESTIFILDDRDYLRKVDNLRSFGTSREEQLFGVALELCLTWINRILFLKLLESQLLTYHNGEKQYRFLNSDFIRGFDDLEELFFSALAKRIEERNERLVKKYEHIPYLNSSLFEPNELEDKALQVSNLKDTELELYEKTILKEGNLKRQTGSLPTLDYLFRFLDAYDFGSDDGEQVDESNQAKSLISASVLGLIFEKINGYKDGSFYTPAYITMYMSRQALRRAVVQKLNAHFGWNCRDFDHLKEDLKDHVRTGDRDRIRQEANAAINTLKICDPAVGSGHFLVSCLNELIALKSELGVLLDAEGKRLNSYIRLDNDELLVEDENEDLFVYKPQQKASQRIQEALFHEKQRLIENCLFGVDINPNSVKICRLRLWIELLKHAYYTPKGQLQTLPNIDINIKTGNSLISRFELDDDLQVAFRSKDNPYSLADYKNAVKEYKQSNDKNRKRAIVEIIQTIKAAFKDSLDTKFKKRIADARGRFEQKQITLQNLEAFGEKPSKKELEELKRLAADFEKTQAEKEEILGNALYNNAFEWRFEFPEVLDEDGRFVGFDVVIGNPPYGAIFNKEEKDWVLNHYQYNDYQLDIYMTFFEKAAQIIDKRISGLLCFIIPNTWILNLKTPNIRKLLFNNFNLISMNAFENPVFDEATVDTMIVFGECQSRKNNSEDVIVYISRKNGDIIQNLFNKEFLRQTYQEPLNIYLSKEILLIKNKIIDQSVLLEGICAITQGTKPFQLGKGVPKQDAKIMEEKPYVQEYKKDETFRPLLRGSLINRYATLWNNNYYISFGDWLAEPRYSAGYDAPQKIVIRQTGSSLIATIDKKQFIVRDNLYTILSKSDDYSELFILGILNSKLLSWYYQNVVNNEVGEALAQVKRGHLSVLPIPKSLAFTAPIVALVEKILTAKSADPNADTLAWEREIDVLVYRLYGLSYEEVRVVDAAFWMSEAEYAG